jgi:D-alanyl-lipoteichoic acid acyltransferase DltB (MBOAT superfamily)
MRPGRILLFLLAVVLTIFLLSLAITNQRSGRGTLFHETDIEDVIHDTVTQADSADTLATFVETAASNEAGDRTVDDRTIDDRPAAESVVPGRTPDAAEAASPAVAAPAPFYPGDALRDSLAGGRQVRILYYGDSQVEGDRVTSLLRRELRDNGGGSGPGLISPVMPVMYTRSYVVRSSSNWKRYTLLDYRNGTFPHNSLGPMLAVCRFTPAGETLATRTFASVRINPVPGADVSVSRYEKLRILYGNNFDTILVGIRSGSTLVDFAMLQMGEGPLEYSVALPSISDVTVEFTGRNSPDIYALSLESNTGVIIDNVPVRGSAGLEFVMTDIKGFEECISKLDPDMIFMQFGLNVVRNVRSEYHYYEEGLVKQIEYLKKATGGVPVVLVSVTDMALRVSDTIRRFPNIRYIRDAQQKAAERSGAIFWDAWESMGGPGSILKWYDHQPPLAAKDLTHLSNAGADTIAARIYSDLLVSRAVTAATPDSARAVAAVTPDTARAAPDTLLTAEPYFETDTSGIAEATIPGQTVEGDLSIAGDNDLTEAEVDEEGDGWVAYILKYNPRQSFIFTSTGFWIFFLVVMAGFALLHRKRAMCHTWLLVVSLYFYYRVGGLFIILLLLTTVLTYYTALRTARAQQKAGRRFWLVTNIVLLLGFLSYFKYAGFITETINSLFNTSLVAHDIFSAFSNSLFGTSFDINNIVLPVGISFFTFQALSYSIDVYRGRIMPERNIADFAFYLTFFPQLVAGPIVRASEFLPQMKGDYTISRNEFGYAVFLILQGLVKKMLISDFISVGFIDRVFETPALYSGFENLMAVYGYGLQIYCDFSGYTDIAIGVAMLMGFRLPLNFNSPYKAANIADFWKRWHISLSRWLKDYLYIPLGGNRKGPVRTGINLMITMLLGGLWHGAAMRFVVWGGLHGIALVTDRIWQWLFRGVRRKSRAARIGGIILTFNFVSFAWIFFRSGSMEEAGLMLTQIFTSFTPGDYGRVIMAYLPVIVLIVSGYILHFLPVTTKEAYRGLFIRLPLVLKFLIAIGTVLLLHKVGTDVVQPFIYFRF